jgi:heme exporter protein B
VIAAALAILAKDLRIETRTREGITSIVVLGVLLVLVFSIAHDPTPSEAPRLAPAVIWVTFTFTGLLAIQRSFVVEREQDCLAALLVGPLDPAALYLGKLLGNVLLLGAMQAIVLPLTALLLHVELAGALPALVVVLLLGNLGFAALATLFGAVAVRVRAREVLLPVLLLPLLVPVLVGGVKATAAVLGGEGLAGATQAVGMLAAFDVIFTTAGMLLFEEVVRD